MFRAADLEAYAFALAKPSILAKSKSSTQTLFQMDSRESPLNQIRIISAFICAHIRTVSASDVKQIWCHAVDSLLVGWSDCEAAFSVLAMCANTQTFQHHHALSNIWSPSSLSSYRDRVAILLPLGCWLTNICMLLHMVKHWTQSWDSRSKLKVESPEEPASPVRLRLHNNVAGGS